MLELLFSDGAAWFTIPALLGSAAFTLQLVLSFLGVAGEGLDADLDLPDHHDGTESTFKILSFQAFTAFAMGFGWAALAGFRTFEWGVIGSIALGVAGGVFMCWLLAIMLKAVHDMQSSGNVPIARCVGHEADVDILVPARREGRGQIRIIIDQAMKHFPAVTEGEELKPGTRVRVTASGQDNAVTVVRA